MWSCSLTLRNIEFGIIERVLKSCSRLPAEKILANLFYEASTTLIPNSEKNSTRKKKKKKNKRLIRMTSLVTHIIKNTSAMQETWVQSLGWEDLLEKGMAIHLSILPWRIPQIEEPGRLQSIGWQSVRDTTERLSLYMWKTSLIKHQYTEFNNALKRLCAISKCGVL